MDKHVKKHSENGANNSDNGWALWKWAVAGIVCFMIAKHFEKQKAAPIPNDGYVNMPVIESNDSGYVSGGYYDGPTKADRVTAELQQPALVTFTQEERKALDP